MEEFEVTYTGDGGIGLGLDPPPYWGNGGSVVTVVIPGGQAFTQGKVKKVKQKKMRTT